MRTFYTALLIVSFAMAGCTLKEPSPGDKEWAPTMPIDPNLSKYSSQGAIYNPHTALSLFETPRARRVGDVLTILLVENTQSQKQQETRQQKNDASTIVNPTLMGQPVSLGGLGSGYNMGFTTDSEREFQGNTQSRQNSKLSGSISVTVARVLSNGNLVVRGEKWVHINQGKEYIRLTGIVRSQDIAPDNTVGSDRVANARISYGGKGQDNDSNAMGWFSRILWSSWFPF